MSNWIQKAKNKMEKKGTTGAFTSWCTDRGYGGVTISALRKASLKNITTRKRAQFAKNVQKKKEGGAVLQSILSNAGAKEDKVYGHS